MTAEEKTTLARFLDRAGDYLRDGYARTAAAEISFQDDPAAKDDAHTEAPSESEAFASLPLAYRMDEDDCEEASGEYTSPEEDGPFPHEAPRDFAEPQALASLTAAVGNCTACGLAATRTNAVPGEGSDRPLVMVIGEGPGADEDASGRPFVGRAGQLLDRMLASIGLFRDRNCYIANMVKCRPPGNRDPAPEEIAACFPFLEQQITLLRPRAILCAGRVAAQNLLKTGKGINALRGTFAEFKPNPAADFSLGDGAPIPVLCTFHPSAILRDESLKRPAWEDLKLLRSHLDSRGEE